MAETKFVKAAFDGMMISIPRYPARAANWAPTGFDDCSGWRSITHLPSGKKLADVQGRRLQEMLCAILDRILPGDTQDEVFASFIALPLELRAWVASWKKGGK